MSISVIRACTRSQVWVKYNIIPYTSTSIKLPHLCQGYHSHCIVTSSDGGMGRLGGGSYMLGFWRGQTVGIIFFLFFVLFLCCCYLVFHGWYMTVCCVCFIVSFLLSLSLVSLGITSIWKVLCLFFKTISKVRFLITNLWISLKKEECFDFNDSLGSLPYVVKSELGF